MDNLDKAIQFHNHLRTIREDRVAKEKFDFPGKLKELGFTAETYRKALFEKFLKETDFDIYYSDQSEFLNKVMEMVKVGKNAFLFNRNTKPCVYSADGIFNEDFCIKNDIPFVKLTCSGGSVVSNIGDLQIACIMKTESGNAHLMNKIKEWIDINCKECEIDGNDILIDGNKVIGTGGKSFGDIDIFYLQISFSVDIDLINTICQKPMIKKPVGLSNYGNKTNIDLMEYLKQWLLQHK